MEALLAMLKSARVDVILTAAVVMSEEVNEALASKGVKAFPPLTTP